MVDIGIGLYWIVLELCVEDRILAKWMVLMFDYSLNFLNLNLLSSSLILDSDIDFAELRLNN